MPLLTRPPVPSGARSAVQAGARSAAQAVVDRAAPSHLALGRAGAGVTMIVRPRSLPQTMGVDSATATRVGWAVQMLGAREVALGLGTLVALRSPDRRSSRTWLAAGVLCDAVDALALTGALLKGRVSKGAGTAVLAVALGAVAVGARGLQQDEADI